MRCAMVGVALVCVVALFGSARVHALSSLRFDAPAPPRVYAYDIELAAGDAADVLAATRATALADLPADLSLTTDAMLAPYYRWAATVVVTPHCAARRRGGFFGAGGVYSTVSLRLRGDDADAAQCSALHQHFCSEAQRTQQLMAKYPAVVLQNAHGEITAVDVDPRLMNAATQHGVSDADRALVVAQWQALVRPLSTYLPVARTNTSQVVSPLPRAASRPDALTHTRVAYHYAAAAAADAAAEEEDAVVIDKRHALGESVARRGSAADRTAVTEKVVQTDAVHALVERGVATRLRALHTLSVSARFQNDEWQSVTTVLTRANLQLVDAAPLTTSTPVAQSDDATVWFADRCAAASPSDADLVLLQLSDASEDADEHEFVQADVVDSEEDSESESDNESQPSQQQQHERVVSSEDMVAAVYADEEEANTSAAAAATTRAHRRARKTRSGADAWGSLEPMRFANSKANVNADTEQTSELVEAIDVDADAAAATTSAASVRDGVDVAGALQKLSVALRSLDALTDHVMATKNAATDADTRAAQIERHAGDVQACTLQWSKLFIAMSAQGKAAAGSVTDTDALNGGTKVSQSGLLYLLTTDVMAAIPAGTGAEAAAKGETYPSAVNVEAILDAVQYPLGVLLDDTDLTPDQRTTLQTAVATSPFGRMRATLTVLNQHLGAAKAAVRAPIQKLPGAPKHTGGVAASFKALSGAWRQVVADHQLTAASVCTGGATGPIAGAVKYVRPALDMLIGSLQSAGGALALARAEARSKLTDAYLRELMSAAGLHSYRVQKSFGDASLVKTTVYSEMAAKIAGTVATLKFAAGVHAEALGRKGSLLELAYAPTLDATPGKSTTLLASDPSPVVSVMGIALQTPDLTPRDWVQTIVPNALFRVVTALQDPTPFIKEMVQSFAALIRDPNAFGGAFFRPPTTRGAPAAVAVHATAQGRSLLEAAAVAHSEAGAGVHDHDGLHAHVMAHAHAHADAVLDAADALDADAMVTTADAAAARANADAEAEEEADAEAAEGVLLSTGARMRSTLTRIPRDPTRAMMFRALKSVVTSTTADGELVALNEKSLPSFVAVVLQYAELFGAYAAECKSAGLPTQAAAFGTATAWFEQVGTDLVSRLWSSVGTWTLDAQSTAADRLLLQHFGKPANKGPAALLSLAATQDAVLQAVLAITHIGAGASPRNRGVGVVGAKPTGPLGPLLTALKAAKTQQPDVKLNGLLSGTNAVYGLVLKVLAEAGDMLGYKSRPLYIAQWRALSGAFRELSVKVNFASSLLLAPAQTSPPATGVAVDVARRIVADRANLDTLAVFADDTYQFLDVALEQMVAKWVSGRNTHLDWFESATRTDATTTGALNAWTAVVDHMRTRAVPALQSLYAKYLSESHGKGVAPRDPTKADYKLQGLLDVVQKAAVALRQCVTVEHQLTQCRAKLTNARVGRFTPSLLYDALHGMTALSGYTVDEWNVAANDALQSADEVDLRPNRWLSTIGTARDALSSMRGVLAAVSKLGAVEALVTQFAASVNPMQSLLGTTATTTGAAAAADSQLVCVGGRKVADRDRGRKTIFTRDFNLLSVQLGPFPVGPVSVVVGLGLNAHTHMDFEFGLCKPTADSPKTQTSTQIVAVGDLAAKVVGDVSVGVGVPYLSMGVQLEITFVDVHLPLHTYADTQRSALAVWGKPYVEALAGKVNAYVDLFIRFAVTIYKWGGVRTTLPNSGLCWQSLDDMAICPPADAWTQRANVKPSGAVASPQVRPANSGGCVPCDYTSQNWFVSGYYSCPLTPRRFAALAGFAPATLDVPLKLLKQIGMRHDWTEFVTVCNESYQPLTLAEVGAARSGTPRRGTYTGTVCVRQFAGDPVPGGTKGVTRAFRVMQGASSTAEAFTSLELPRGDPGHTACLEFATKHSSYTNYLLPKDGVEYWRDNDVRYALDVATTLPRFQLSLSYPKGSDNTPAAAVPFLQLVKPGTDEFRTPVAATVTAGPGGVRTGMCVRCRNTLQGKTSSSSVYECPMHGRRGDLFFAAGRNAGWDQTLYARQQMGALSAALASRSRALPTSPDAYVYVCDEYLVAGTSGVTGGYLFVREQVTAPFKAFRYTCALGASTPGATTTTTKSIACKTYDGLSATAYDQAVTSLADKTFEYQMRVFRKHMPCRPAPVRVHRPSDKLKAGGMCHWCQADSATDLECGLDVFTDKGNSAKQIYTRRFGPLEVVNPAEFESLQKGMNKFASAGWAAARARYPSAWPPLNADGITHIALCDEQVLVDSQATRPVVVFDVQPTYNAAGDKFKVEYALSWVATPASGPKVTHTVGARTWPSLMALDAKLRGKYPDVVFPEFPSNGDPFLVAFGLAGGDPDATLRVQRAAAMKAYFDGVAQLQTVWNDYHFSQFFDFDTKLPSDGTSVAAYLCVNAGSGDYNGLSDCVKIESTLSQVLALAGASSDRRPVTTAVAAASLATKADQTAPYFFHKQVMDSIAATLDMAASRCDAMPPGMQAEDASTSVADYVD